jgi:N-methylhydantoinase A
LDEGRAREVLSKLAREMSAEAGRRVTAIEAALGVVRVVNANMERALRVISVERGHDPREFSLLPFGGAGGLHAVGLARGLRIPRVVAPRSAGALSALGALSSDVVKDWSRTVMLEATAFNRAKMERVFGEMEREARRALTREGFSPDRQRHERLLAVRYQGQSFELEVRWGGGGDEDVAAAFHRAHLSRYGYAQEANRVEVVSLRVRSVGVVLKLRSERAARATRRGSVARPRDFARVHFAGGAARTAVYARDELAAGARLRTPCVVTEYSATTLIPAGARAALDAHGNLIIVP